MTKNKQGGLNSSNFLSLHDFLERGYALSIFFITNDVDQNRKLIVLHIGTKVSKDWWISLMKRTKWRGKLIWFWNFIVHLDVVTRTIVRRWFIPMWKQNTNRRCVNLFHFNPKLMIVKLKEIFNIRNVLWKWKVNSRPDIYEAWQRKICYFCAS